MKSEMMREWEQLKRRSVALEKKLYSEDPKVAKTAETQLKENAKGLRAWAKKYKVKLTRYVETHPVAARTRRRCRAYREVTIGGKEYMCSLIGRQGRKCSYDCIDGDGTIDPFR